MRPLVLVVALAGVAVVASGSAAPLAATQPARTMALTFDDLPFVQQATEDEEDPLENARQATPVLLQALAEFQAPAVGFVNEGKLEGPHRAAYTAILRQWVEAGVVLGNHTFSHADLNTKTAAEFQDDITRGEAVTRQLMQARQPYTLYFRHPFTHTGDTVAKKDAISQFLVSRNYKIAPHTIDSADYMFNVAFVRAWAIDDPINKYRSLTQYVDFVLRATTFAEGASRQLFGRDIPQVMLLHANDINVESLGEILRRLSERGYSFISLDQALGDPAYQTPDTTVTTNGPTWLWRWNRSKGTNVDFSGDPDPPQWVMDAYNSGRR